VAEVADVEVEQAVFVEVERGGGAADEAFAAEVCAGGDVLEFGVAEVLVNAMIVVGVGDEDVLQAVVVKVGDDWLARLAGASIGALPIQTRRFGDVSEVAFAVAEIERVAGAAEDEYIGESIAIHILGRDARAAQCGRNG